MTSEISNRTLQRPPAGDPATAGSSESTLGPTFLLEHARIGESV
jgi:hypothetical protein